MSRPPPWENGDSVPRPGPPTQPLRLPTGRKESSATLEARGDSATALPYANGVHDAYGSSSASSSMHGRNATSATRGPSAPHRPARSQRRPLSMSPTASPGESGQGFDSLNGHFDDYDMSRSMPARAEQPAPTTGLQSKLHRAIEANRRAAHRTRPSSVHSFDSASSLNDDEPPRPDIHPVAGPSRPPVNGYPRPPGAAASGAPKKSVNDALAAFAAAGQRQQRTRATSIAPPPRRRRGAESAQGVSVKFKGKQVDYPATPAFREIERVLSRIESEWPELIPPEYEDDDGRKRSDFDAVTLALSLLDPQLPPDRFRSFLRLKEDLGRALKSHIQLHYQAFDTSVSAYNNVLANLGSAQKETTDLRSTLTSVRDTLLTRRTELTGMMARRTELNEMDNVMDTLDQLKNVPDKLESLLSEKRFLSAVVLLVRSLKTISKPEMGDAIGVADLRTYLQGQEAAIVDILLDELHGHLYLKSFFCDSRWRSYSRGQATLQAVDWGPDKAEELLVPAGADLSDRPARTHSKPSRLARFLGDLAKKPSVDPIVAEPQDAGAEEYVTDPQAPDSPSDARSPTVQESDHETKNKSNPEEDSFAYIEGLLESLACLGKLAHAIDTMLQRMPVETYNLVEATVEEVEERNEPSRRGSALHLRPASTLNFAVSGAGNRASLLRLTMAQQNAADMGAETLRDLFWTLYSKLDAVLQGFRVANEVTQRISERRKFQDSTEMPRTGNVIFSLLEVWKPIQSEVRALLNDYLTDGDDGVNSHSSRNQLVSVSEVLRTGRLARDPNKAIFRFAETDTKGHPNKVIKAHEDELFAAIKASVPGLVQASNEHHLSAPVFGTNVGTSDDRLSGGPGGSGGTHRLLVAPDAFNVSVLFAPTLAFLDRVRDVMPGGLVDDDKGFGAFLDDFILSIFLPQLEDKVQSVYLHAVGANDAFQEDTRVRTAAGTPVVKVVTNLLQLISNLCSMLRSTPFHRERYSQLIITVVEHFLQRCQERFKDLTQHEAEHSSSASAQSTSKMAAIWAQRRDVNAVLHKLQDVANAAGGLQEEVLLEQKLRGDASIQQRDLIPVAKRLTGLGVLYSSLIHFLVHVRKLRGTTDTAPTADLPTTDAGASSSDFRMPLTVEDSQRLDSLLRAYDSLADSAIFTLRIEARLRAIHYLERAMLEGVYALSSDVAEPDPFIVDLNSSLSECDECAASSMASAQRTFVLYGLSEMIDSLIVTLAPRVRAPTTAGVHKMLRNILALQQNLRNLGDTPLPCDFRSRRYWDLIRQADPDALVESLQTIEGRPPFSFEEYEWALAMICGVDPNKTPAKDGNEALETPISAGVTSSKRRLFNESLIGLHAAFGAFGDDE